MEQQSQRSIVAEGGADRDRMVKSKGMMPRITKSKARGNKEYKKDRRHSVGHSLSRQRVQYIVDRGHSIDTVVHIHWPHTRYTNWPYTNGPDTTHNTDCHRVQSTARQRVSLIQSRAVTMSAALCLIGRVVFA